MHCGNFIKNTLIYETDSSLFLAEKDINTDRLSFLQIKPNFMCLVEYVSVTFGLQFNENLFNQA